MGAPREECSLKGWLCNGVTLLILKPCLLRLFNPKVLAFETLRRRSNMMISIASVCFDIGKSYGSASQTVEFVISETQKLWDSGSDIVVFPEYMWGTLAQYSDPQSNLVEIADLFWGKLWPRLSVALSRDHKTVILGTVPRRASNGQLYNTCPVITSGQVIYQDKLALTPWEHEFTGGTNLIPFQLSTGHTAVVMICLDCEMPDLITKLKKNARVDLIFIPSATESLMGVERIARCASARAVELGAAVITSAICGEVKDNEFLGANIGRTALYLPSLKGIESQPRIIETDPQTVGYHVEHFKIDQAVFDIARNETTTTNPANINPMHDVSVVKFDAHIQQNMGG
jgi:predicted amidohydrolase